MANMRFKVLSTVLANSVGTGCGFTVLSPSQTLAETPQWYTCPDTSAFKVRRDALMAARYQGVRTVEYDGKRITYASDGEMAAALADLNRQVAGATRSNWPPLASTSCRRPARLS